MDIKTEAATREAADSRRPSATEQLRSHGATVREDVREFGRLARDAAKEQLGDAQQTASELLEQGKRKADDLEARLTQYVREKPIKSLLIAAGIGVALGMLWSRK